MKYDDAQIALKNESTWVIIGPGWRENGLMCVCDLPSVNCPAIDTRKAKRDQVRIVVNKYVSDGGVDHLDSFITELLNLGCSMTVPANIHSFSLVMN